MFWTDLLSIIRSLDTVFTATGICPTTSVRPDQPWGPPSLLYNGYRVVPGGKVRPERAADPSPH